MKIKNGHNLTRLATVPDTIDAVAAQNINWKKKSDPTDAYVRSTPSAPTPAGSAVKENRQAGFNDPTVPRIHQVKPTIKYAIEASEDKATFLLIALRRFDLTAQFLTLQTCCHPHDQETPIRNNKVLNINNLTHYSLGCVHLRTLLSKTGLAQPCIKIII